MNTRKWAILILALAIFLAVGVSLLSDHAGQATGAQPDPVPIAPPAPGLSAAQSPIPVYTLQGRFETVDASKTPLLFFAPWCPHCQADVPNVQKELAAMQTHRHVILVATFLHTSDQQQAIAQVQTFIAKYHITMPVVIQADQATQYVREVPTLVWTNKTIHEGLPTQENLQLALAK